MTPALTQVSSDRQQSTHRDDASDPVGVTQVTDEAPEAFEVLASDYTMSLLSALSTGPKRGCELTDACDAARSTVYRRLDQLVAAGFVTTDIYVHPDGHHCKLFRLYRDAVTLSVEPDCLEVTVRRDGSNSDLSDPSHG